jgi:hypothetical protein
MFLVFILVCIYIEYITTSWVDPDTIEKFELISSFVDEKKYKLVFSDEFEIDNRKFDDGFDPKWKSINKDDYTNYALQYYNSKLVHTSHGKLNITTIIDDVSFIINSNEKKGIKEVTKNYQSGMVQGWNKFCFTGGIVEVSVKLPGKSDIGGLWPAIWLMGNLARATYVGSSNNIWPWSYDECNRELQHQQAISKCNKVNHFDLYSNQGRGAPEIDILEVMPGRSDKLINTDIRRPYYSSSLQVAPGIYIYIYTSCVFLLSQ